MGRFLKIVLIGFLFLWSFDPGGQEGLSQTPVPPAKDLSVRIGSIDIDRFGDLAAADGDLQVAGREDAKRVLKSIYGDIKRGLCVTSEIVSGYDAALLGNLVLESTKEGAPSKSWPISIYMEFNPYGMIARMTIAVVDLQPLTDAVRSAAQTGALKTA